MDNIDRSAEAYALAWENALAEVVKRYPALSKLTQAEAATLLTQINMDDLLRGTYGMDKALENLAISFAREIIISPAPPVLPSPEVLEASLRFQVDSANTQITQTASEIKKIMMASILGRQSEAEFAKALNSNTLRPDQINSYVNQNMRSFHRSVELQMAEANPQEMYIWDGPRDDRTSDECLNMIAEGALTLDEWNAKGYGPYLSGGTHYGCRHTLARYVDEWQLRQTVAERKERGVNE